MPLEGLPITPGQEAVIGASAGPADAFAPQTAAPVVTPSPVSDSNEVSPADLGNIFGTGVPDGVPLIQPAQASPIVPEQEPVPAQQASPPQQPVAPVVSATPPPVSSLDQLVASDPAVASAVFKAINDSMSPGEPASAVIEKPTAPSRPSDYAADLAFSDPASSSWRYRESMDSYRDSMAQYRSDVNAAQLAEVNKSIAASQESQAAVDNRNNLYRDAVGRGATPQQAAEYVKFVDSQSITPDLVWQMFQLQSAPQQGAPTGALSHAQNVRTIPQMPQVNPVQARSRQINYPTPAIGGSPTPGPVSEVDAIWGAIEGVNKGADPFAVLK